MQVDPTRFAFQRIKYGICFHVFFVFGKELENLVRQNYFLAGKIKLLKKVGLHELTCICMTTTGSQTTKANKLELHGLKNKIGFGVPMWRDITLKALKRNPLFHTS